MAEQIFQVGIKGLIRNGSGEILMVHIPKWSGNEAHWDLPGGRMDPGENLLDTLKRELLEEIGVPFVGRPKQLRAFLTNITIPLGKGRVPLIIVVYEVNIAEDSTIRLDPNGAETEYKWFIPKLAAREMEYKFDAEFCDYIRQLKLTSS